MSLFLFSKEGIHTNVTLIFSVNQALLAARAGATYVSPFLGRLDDISMPGIDLISDIAEVFALHDIETEIINKYSELKDKFEFLGFLDNPYNIIKKCDYLVLLSENETWGLVITEAKILGVPCIVTDFEAAYEQILDNETGIILSRQNIDSYEDKIDAIINNKNIYKEKLKNFKWSNDEILKKWKKMI